MRTCIHRNRSTVICSVIFIPNSIPTIITYIFVFHLPLLSHWHLLPIGAMQARKNLCRCCSRTDRLGGVLGNLGGLGSDDGGVHGLHPLLDIGVGGNELLEGIGSLVVEAGKLDHVTGSTGKLGEVVLVAVLLTLLGGSDVDLVTLKVDGLLHDPGKDPGTLADTGGLEGKADDQEDVGEGVGKEGDGKGRSNKLPRDGSHDGGDDGTEEAGVEEVLEGVADAPKVGLTLGDGKSGHTSDDEEAGNNGKLTANHEAGKVAALALEEEVAGLESELGLATVLLLDLGDGEEGNLHTLEHTDDGHEDEEKDDGDASGNTLPHNTSSQRSGSLSDDRSASTTTFVWLY